jgi:uncharacterized lipoprotein YbaY
MAGDGSAERRHLLILRRMSLWLDIASADGTELPPGSALRIEVRDASWADGPARVLHRVETRTPSRALLFPVELRLEAFSPDAIVWIHLDADGDGRVSAGDYITTQSYPLASRAPGRMRVELRRVG